MYRGLFVFFERRRERIQVEGRNRRRGRRGKEQQRQLDCSQAFHGPGWGKGWPFGVAVNEGVKELDWFARPNLREGRWSDFWDFENDFEMPKNRSLPMFSKMENGICFFWFLQHRPVERPVADFQLHFTASSMSVSWKLKSDISSNSHWKYLVEESSWRLNSDMRRWSFRSKWQEG